MVKHKKLFCKYLSANLFVSVFVAYIATVSLSSEVFVLIVTNRSTNRPTRRHAKVRARDDKEKSSVLQYYNTDVAFLQYVKKRFSGRSQQERQSSFYERKLPQKQQKMPISSGKWAEKRLSIQSLSLRLLLTLQLVYIQTPVWTKKNSSLPISKLEFVAFQIKLSL